MYPGWTGQLICVYQPWFGLASHISIGYDEQNTAALANQDTKMINRGCNINLVSFYGTTYDQGGDDGWELTTTNLLYSDLAGRTSFPLKFGVLEVEGPLINECSPATTSCVETALEADMDYINLNYAGASSTSTLYWMDQGTYVVGFFGSCPDFPGLNCTSSPSDWDTIWTAVQNYVNGKNYNFKFIFKFGDFSKPSISAGEYAWPPPAADTTDNDAFVDNPQVQWWWCDPTGISCTGASNGYLDNFYTQGKNNYPTKLSIGALFSGFDDSNASWTQGRVIAQQCGQVLLDAANEVTAGGFWGTTNQIPYMMITTWNDYEEGTEQESGVDNCYTAVNTTLAGNVMSWTLTSSDSTYATINTIHHYALWTAVHNGTTLTLRKQLSHTATSANLASLGLPKGTYDVYLEMIGQPSMQNEMSNRVTDTQN